MKKVLGFIASLVLIASANAAHAGQFEIYVTGATHVSQPQAELSTLVQKGILVDTVKRTLSLQLSPICKSGQMCPEYIRAVSLPLISFQSRGGVPITLVAQGKLSLNGVESFTQVNIALNADNSMDITINNSFGCKSNVSQFIGSPATEPTILF
ncbi:MAG: hypothetical protein H7333_05035 [Bdellovibrionales bacterium]|nr:hypothetical protein [Oligoflexia bacterium]